MLPAMAFDSAGQTAWNLVALALFALACIDAFGLWRRATRSNHPLVLLLMVGFYVQVNGWYAPLGAAIYLGAYRWAAPETRAV